jgi:hypothetical protein
VLVPRPPSESALVLGREVWLVGVGADEHECVPEMHDGDVRGHARQCGAGELDGSAGGGPDLDHHSGEDVAEHGEHVAVVVDEPELDVERDVLREVPDGVVGFGAEHRAGLVDPFEYADHHLLVELRRLGEIGGAPEVVDGEHVGAGLRRHTDDLGCLDLGEALRIQCLSKPAQGRRRQPPYRLLRGVAPQHGRMIEEHGKGHRE